MNVMDTRVGIKRLTWSSFDRLRLQPSSKSHFNSRQTTVLSAKMMKLILLAALVAVTAANWWDSGSKRTHYGYQPGGYGNGYSSYMNYDHGYGYGGYGYKGAGYGKPQYGGKKGSYTPWQY
ncbi:neuropeptide-like protein 31 isoform X1 [Lingula anatina]|uniref:Neuropeptide-like protein 31 isoform X1 n=1 Tax=Lingula anatina TaxID=7574 RepID=A0A1S3K8G3_LINAN|nr:neuropeptide-like protein 31 isoform X1 [Lingula anatina]|eukprot:XP_013418925.1 neuropeptide-like protein 31 isoform X1 [Lingula anatina]